MISCDTDILLHACNAQSPFQKPAEAFFAEHADDDEFAVCELVLMEL